MSDPHLRGNLYADLKEPKDLQCLMLKTPLKLVTKSYKTPIVMWFLMVIVYKILLMYLFPLYYNKLTLIYTQLVLFGATVFLHLLSMFKDPGYIKSPRGVGFMEMMKIFDPVLLCADCEVVRTDRSRHCSICNRCVERFDHHCPWINNCVGLNNHGVFVTFLLSMSTLLITTFISLIINFKCYENFEDLSRPRDSGKYLYEDLFLPDWLYSKEFIISVTVFCLLVCGMFICLVLLLTGV